MTKARPILCSTPMVEALLAGRKSQTRRVCKDMAKWDVQDCREARFYSGEWYHFFKGAKLPTFKLKCPYGAAGDYLWVRESFGLCRFDGGEVWYWADGDPSGGDWTKPKPSIHMPKWASRLTLKITDIRVERLQDITEEDTIAEGVLPHSDKRNSEPHVASYATLWNELHPKCQWSDNAWVWKLSFRTIQKNIDEVLNEEV